MQFKFFLNKKKQQLSKKKNPQQTDFSYKKLAFMWALMFVGYFMFILQWYSLNNFAANTGSDHIVNGWAVAFFPGGKQSALAASAPNWMITLGRGVGSIVAGYWIAKFGHKYAVIFVLGIMIASFPFLIICQNASWNALSIAGGAAQIPDGTEGGSVAIAGFSLFVIFRTLYAIGGTTLITYTNSVIAKMPANKKTMHMGLNQFTFAGGAFLANLPFIFPGVFAAVADPVVWTTILSVLFSTAGIVLIIYLLTAVEVVPKQQPKSFSKNKYTVKDGFIDKEAWPIYGIFIVWLISVVFTNSTSIKNMIEQSPANAFALIKYNTIMGIIGSEENPFITTMKYTEWYYWIWPAYICSFMGGFGLAYFTILKFNQTKFNRKNFIMFLYVVGFATLFMSYCCGYYGGYANPVAVAFFLFFAFIAGACLLGVQPIIFTIPQQQMKSNAEYMGTIAGLIWGIGYLSYSFVDASLSSIVTYVSPIHFEINGGTTVINSFSDLIRAGINAIPSHDSIDNYHSLKDLGISYSHQTWGYIAMIVIMWLLLCGGLVLCKYLPESGYWKNGKFIAYKEKWNPFNWRHYNFWNPKYQVK